MYLPLLILPALAATLAANCVHTIPADLRDDVLRHDASGKAPLTVAKMTAARGAGSACRDGCNDGNIICWKVYDPNNPYPNQSPVRVYSQVWSPHSECVFAFGSATCTNPGDVLCNTVYDYNTSDLNCSSPPKMVDHTWTASCALIVPPSGPGN